MLKHKQSAIAIAIGALLAGCGGGDSQSPSAAVSQSRSSAQLLAPAPLEDSSRIAAGVDFSAALHADGTVFAWGSNAYGQLGQAGNGMSPAPAPVAGMSGVKAIAAGGYHATAVLQNGTVWAWGNNTYGQLGNGGLSIGRERPAQVLGISNVKAISAGYAHNLAVTNDGTAWGWGRSSGSLQPLAAPVRGLSPVLAASAGAEFSLVINRDNSVSGWGDNSYGQLGSRASKVYVKQPVRIAGLENIVAVSAGNTHALALSRSGAVWAWGSDDYGQLGTHAGNSASPKQVAGLPAPNSANPIRSILAGALNSAVVYADGSVWMWGSNLYGQYGDGSTRSSSKPIRVDALADAGGVALGNGFTVVLNKGGSAWAMGLNARGQLGNNTTVSARIPVQVAGRSGVGNLDLGKSTAK